MNQFSKSSYLTILLGCLVLSGCKGLYVGPIPGHKNDTSQSIAKKQSSYKEHKINSFIVNKDVDVVFIKVKNEFGFWTEQEMRADFGSAQSLADTKLASDGFAYSEIPGVRYNMRKYIFNAGEEKKKPGHRKGNVMDVTIEKESAYETKVSLVYWSQYGPQETAKYNQWIKSKLEKALSSKLF